MALVFPPQATSPTPFGGPTKSVQASPPTMPQTSKAGVAPTASSRAYYVEQAKQAARKYGVPEEMFVRQIQRESGFNPTARSQAGAIGIAQIVPRFHPGVDPTNAEASLDYAAKWMSKLAQQFGRWDYALAAYHSGPTAVHNAGEVPSVSQSYVANILGYPSEGKQNAEAFAQLPPTRYARGR